ncbi:MAG: response regulator transcription factor [Balneolaceae bacterium]|nr:response regulator transcription factor [Balneolaceae bacterium]MBO6546016.1 response regulator transcription factor [Balneolaceae bacterium]MBO6647412.1 response regulator transcription factor [Balneolaceae bacterium]
MGTIKTIVADGNEIFRHGLSSILREADFEICSEVDNGALVLTAYESVKPDLCVLSFSMPEISGIQLANKIIEKYPDANVLMMADSDNDAILNDFLDSGANGLLLKSAHRIELIDAALKVANGENFLGKQFSKMMTREYLRLARMRKGKKQITHREKEVLSLLVEGMTSSEIAKKLFISPRTVDKHRTNLLKKLGQKNTAGLVRYALQNKHLV